MATINRLLEKRLSESSGEEIFEIVITFRKSIFQSNNFHEEIKKILQQTNNKCSYSGVIISEFPRLGSALISGNPVWIKQISEDNRIIAIELAE